jgi:GT2 family glycosyltransferase
LIGETLLVDNASTDGTAEAVRARFPQVRVIASQENLGFARANNLALRQAQGRYILLLNPDTEVAAGTVAAMLAVLTARPEVGLVGCRLILPDGRLQLDAAREFPSLLNAVLLVSGLARRFPRHRFFGRMYRGDWDHLDARDVPCLVGACLMARRSVLEQVGLHLDETLPLYFEDVELCYRVGRAGYRLHYLGTHTVTHFQGESSRASSRSDLVDMLQVASPYLFLRRYGGGRGPALVFRLIVLKISGLRWLAAHTALALRRPGPRWQRALARARAWWRFAWAEYRRIEAGGLTFVDENPAG